VIEPVLAAPAPKPLVVEPVLAAPAPKPLVVEPVLAAPAPKPLVVEPVVLEAPAQPRVAASRTAPGRRVARRRSPIPLPGAPLLMGVAILAVSAGGALQAMHSDTAAAADAHHLAPASALSGSSAVGTASLLGDRTPSVSRSSDRLQAAADAQGKQRAATLSGYASKAQKQSAKIQLHAWVLPVAAGVYHLTARFGDYSSLWSNFHTGLDFASPTGTPIMAVAGGTISETSYSGAYGNRTIETLPDGTELWYCHQNEFGTTVGATVRPGEVIGYVGSTGNVTGPHLHLEVHPGGGDPVDPYTALEVHGLHP
jgi:murein DD-endopeptidase MepM/ murein hydrolase activator NlpD